MTISSSTRKAGPFSGNGTAVAFAFTFKVFQPADVLVVQTDLSGVETTKTLTADYTVTLNANQDTNPGGTVTMNAAPLSGYLLTLGSQVTYTQGMVLTNTGGFFPQVINDMADRGVILVQQLFEKLNRAVTLPFSASTGVSTTLPLPSPGKIIGWNMAGTGMDNFTPAGLGLVVGETAASGSAILPGGPTANRDAAPGQGYFRFNSNTNVLEWFNGTAWVTVTDANAFSAALAFGGLVTLTKAGDQFVATNDASPFRRGSWPLVASGALYTLLGDFAMEYWTHNTALDASGNFLGRDKAGTCTLYAFGESGFIKIYSAATAAAGVVPVFGLLYSLDTTTGILTPTGGIQGVNSVVGACITGLLPTAISGTNTTAAVTISSGQATDSSGVRLLNSPGHSWLVGNGNAANGYQGGTTLPNSTTIHFFECLGGSGYCSFASTSLAPTLPAGYAYYRRIFSLLTNSSGALNVVSPIETAGGAMLAWLATQVADINGVTPSTASRTLYTLSVPQGIKVQVMGRLYSTTISGGQMILLTSPDETDVAPSSTGTPWFDLFDSTAYVNTANAGKLLTTNASGQIGARSNVATASSLSYATSGFVDFRRN